MIFNQFLPFSQLLLHVHVRICDRTYICLRSLFHTITPQSAANMMGVLLSQEMKAKGDKLVLICAIFNLIKAIIRIILSNLQLYCSVS